MGTAATSPIPRGRDRRARARARDSPTSVGRPASDQLDGTIIPQNVQGEPSSPWTSNLANLPIVLSRARPVKSTTALPPPPSLALVLSLSLLLTDSPVSKRPET